MCYIHLTMSFILPPCIITPIPFIHGWGTTNDTNDVDLSSGVAVDDDVVEIQHPIYRVLDVSGDRRKRILVPNRNSSQLAPKYAKVENGVQECETMIKEFLHTHCCQPYTVDELLQAIPNSQMTRHVLQGTLDEMANKGSISTIQTSNAETQHLILAQPLLSLSPAEWQHAQLFVVLPSELQYLDLNSTLLDTTPSHPSDRVATGNGANISDRKKKRSVFGRTKVTSEQVDVQESKTAKLDSPVTVTPTELRVNAIRNELQRQQQQIGKLQKELKYATADKVK